jgi:hypothetical protein
MDVKRGSGKFGRKNVEDNLLLLRFQAGLGRDSTNILQLLFIFIFRYF